MQIKTNKQIKQIFLHIGLHKTGSTSIQNTLYSNRKLLLKNNIYYPKKWVSNHSVPLYSMFCDSPEEYHIHIRLNRNKEQVNLYNKRSDENFRNEILGSNCDRLIISGEGISLLTEKNLLDLKIYLNNLMPNANIIVLIFFREISRFIISSYQEKIKMGMNLKISEFLFETNIYKERTEKFINVFNMENIQTFSFEDVIKKPQGLVGEFLLQIGLPENELKKIIVSRKNKSLSNKAVDIILFINQENPLIKGNKISKERFNTDTLLLHELEGEKFTLSQTEIKSIQERHKNDTLWLKETFKIEFNTELKRDKTKKEIIYTEDDFKKIKKIYPNLSPFIKRKITLYFEKKEETSNNNENKQISKKIFLWTSSYKSIINITNTNYYRLLRYMYLIKNKMVRK